MNKENDKRRQEHIELIRKTKEELSKLAPWHPHYKDLMKYYKGLIKDLKDYDIFRGYNK